MVSQVSGREDSPWLESIVVVGLEVLDEKLLLTGSSRVASGENHSLSVSSWVSESNAEVLVGP